jgi:hypothetical protein
MRVGVASGRHAAQIHEALSQRIGIEADIVPPDADAKQYDLILAVDDEIVPAGTETRRYVTHHKTQASEWNVVAGRYLLTAAIDRGITNPIAVPLPFTTPVSAKPPPKGVALLQDELREDLTVALNAASHQVLDIDDPQVGIVIDSALSTSEIEPLRKAMSEEKVVVAMRCNHAATDTIRHRSDGYLVSERDELVATVQALTTNNLERTRVGFEARRTIAETNWARVTRALLLNNRNGMPDLEQFSCLPARQRWKDRLGHARKWHSAQYLDDGRVTFDGETVDIRNLSQLRKMSIALAIRRRDPCTNDS